MTRDSGPGSETIARLRAAPGGRRESAPPPPTTPQRDTCRSPLREGSWSPWEWRVTVGRAADYAEPASVHEGKVGSSVWRPARMPAVGREGGVLATLAMGRTVVSYGQCAAQFFFFTVCAGTECFLLSVMALDRYVAVSIPLLYTVAMPPRICWALVLGAYVCGLTGSILHTSCTFTLSFCDDNQINFFFCDLPPLLKLACSDTKDAEVIIIFFGNFVILVNALVILTSYLLIIKAVLKVSSSGGRAKAFSTCASHLTAVALFFGTLAFMYLRSASGTSLEEDKVVSVFYTVVIPMLNPLIYSLRNTDVKAAFRKVTERQKETKGRSTEKSQDSQCSGGKALVVKEDESDGFTKSTIVFTVSSLFLLAVMAYDRFVAISSPLSYNVVMSPDIRLGLLAGAYVCGLSGAILHTVCAFTLSFCDDNQINFFCHLPPLLKLASHSMTQSETVILFPAKHMFLANGTIILVSYTLIIRTLRF
ncbi:unnamed protein product [Rangifer tarandus platyrhynchus]|uniref:Uncharacterized protein n=2 Tax=Rangifer tarandus platyrhynchus TaxID=3082113 RepID=A0ACB0DVY0_RANTA|nr:unnamed protein product [Rangifer tarandus platyrhynchus]CAI9692482.1 unnamed protein product [Rangifer tarandus platyrhynchus]